MNKRVLSNFTAVALSLVFGSAAWAASLTGTFSENFDGMGTTGTTAPTGWSLWAGNSGTSNATWTNTTGIPGNGANSVASLVASSGVLTAVTTPSTTNNNGFNAAASAGTPSDRLLATSATTVSGGAIQLQLTNNTGVALSNLWVSYDTVRYAAVATSNELPGYEFFYSLDDATWTNVAALNPTIAGPGGVIVPNTAGTTTVPLTDFNLSTSVPNGSDFFLRWVDDNAQQTSPDQIMGLNNVTVSNVPEPAATGLLSCSGLGLGLLRRRKK